jgi:uracil-DNA glycosylase
MSVDSAELVQLQHTMRACRLCYDAGHAIVPGAVFSGNAKARVMLIGQAPGVTEVDAKRPFNASSGRRLFDWLGQAGWAETDFRARHYMTAVTKCFPGKHPNGKGDRVPSKAEQALCRPFLEREMALVNPALIIPVGKLAIQLFFPNKATLKQLIGHGIFLPHSADGQQSTWPNIKRGQRTNRDDVDRFGRGRYIVPLPHPSGASLWPNRPANKRLIDGAIQLLSEIRVNWKL